MVRGRIHSVPPALSFAEHLHIHFSAHSLTHSNSLTCMHALGTMLNFAFQYASGFRASRFRI